MSKKISPATADALRQLDTHLNPLWQLGRNAVLAWTTHKSGLRVIVIPVRELLRHVSQEPALLRGPRFLEEKAFNELAATVEVIPVEIISSLRVGHQDPAVPWETIERVIRRYSITETLNRGVVLFDIVGFSKLTSIQQIAQLNSLEYCINMAHRRARDWSLPVEVARSTTGDGFYVWNRTMGMAGDIALLLLLLLTLAENDQERSLDRHRMVPVLRSVFSIGRHYGYYQIEGLSPRGYDYIVGDVTISLARLIQKTGAGQVLIGSFERATRDGGSETIATPEFVAHADKYFRKLVGRELGGHQITEAAINLTGSREHGYDKLFIDDKHGIEHIAYNAQAKIYRGGRIPILLGMASVRGEPAAAAG